MKLPILLLVHFLLSIGFTFNVGSASKTSTLNDRVAFLRRDTEASKKVLRSDDADILQTVVAQQAQALTALTAKLEAAEASIIHLENAQRSVTDNLKNAQDTIRNLEEAQRNASDLLKTAQDTINNLTESSVGPGDATCTCNMTSSQGSGSVFVRWGKSQCPSEAETIYSGLAAGSSSHSSGGAANRLCLTKEPVFDDLSLTGLTTGHLFGAHYDVLGHLRNDVVCAVCHTSYSSTFMVPGTNRCPTGTTEQYRGHLVAGNDNDQAPSEFLCLDAEPEDGPGSASDTEAAYFVPSLTQCGSLSCPPYQSGKPVTCVVCSI